MYSFSYTFTERDFYEFNKHNMYNSPSSKKTLKYLDIFIAIVMIVLGFALARRSAFPLLIRIIFVAIAAVSPFISKPTYNRVLRKIIKKMKKQGKLPYSHNVEIVFQEDYFTVNHEHGQSKSYYSSLERIECGDNGVYIYNSAASAYTLPNYLFEDDCKKASFVDFIEQKIRDNANANPPDTM